MTATKLREPRQLKGCWLRTEQTPLSRSFLYTLIKAGIIESMVLKAPGSKRGIRLICGDSLDAFLRDQVSKQSRKSGVSK